MRLSIKQFKFFLIQLIWVMFSLLLASYYFLGKPQCRDIDVIILSYFLMLQAAWGFWSWKSATGMPLYNPYLLFLLACYLFNCGQCFLFLFGFQPQGILDNKFTTETLVKTQAFLFFSFACFHGGALMRSCMRRKTRIDAEATDNTKGYIPEGKATFNAGLILFLMVFIPSVSLIAKYLSVVWHYGYLGLYQVGGATTRTYAVLRESFFILMASLFFLYSGSRAAKKTAWPISVIIVILCGFFFFLGIRSRATMILVMTLWLWLHGRSLPKWVSLTVVSGVALGLLILFPVVWTMRNLPGTERFSVETLLHATALLPDNPVVMAIREMGGTMQTLAYTIELVPAARPYGLGSSYVWALTTALPNLFFPVHPAAAHKLADWLVWTVDPGWASLGGGLGYSMFAEAYCNFGWFFGSIVMSLIGYLIAWPCVWWWERPGSPLRSAYLAVIFAFLLFFPRGESFDMVRPIVWYGGFLYVTARFILASKRRRRFDVAGRDGLHHEVSDCC